MTESTKQHQRAKGLSRSEKMICLALFLMTFVGVPYYIHWHTDTIEWRRSHYAHIVVELEVDGEPVIFDRIIECKYMPAQGGGEWFARISNMRSWPSFPYPVARKLAHTMDDGTHVMLRTPRVCARKRAKKTREELDELRPLPAGWVPRVAIAENVAARDKVEVYIEPAAYTHPDSRVTYKGTRFSFLKNAKPSPLDKDAWFFSDYYEGIQGEFGKRGEGYIAKSYFIYPESFSEIVQSYDELNYNGPVFFEIKRHLGESDTASNMVLEKNLISECRLHTYQKLPITCKGTPPLPLRALHLEGDSYFADSTVPPFLIAVPATQIPISSKVNVTLSIDQQSIDNANTFMNPVYVDISKNRLIILDSIRFDSSN